MTKYSDIQDRYRLISELQVSSLVSQPNRACPLIWATIAPKYSHAIIDAGMLLNHAKTSYEPVWAGQNRGGQYSSNITKKAWHPRITQI